jgi:PIN domain nuclease of toxin-antitoxin system
LGNSEVILLDTHTWVWFLSNPELLSDRGAKMIDDAVKDRSIIISSISVWEVALLVEKQRLLLTMDLDDWIAKAQALPFCTFVPIDNHIAMQSVRLPLPLHNDPADRMIIATAMELDATIVTKDEKILDYPHIDSVW